MKFRKKQVEVDAIQWTGNNLKEIIEFTGLHHSAKKWTWEEYEEVVRKDIDNGKSGKQRRLENQGE